MITFNDEEWEIYFVSPLHPQLLMENGKYGLGVCDDVQKKIFINKDLNNHYMKKVLAHELTHAAAFSYNVILTYEEHEFLADFVATHGKKIIELTNNLFKNYKKK